MIISIANQKGGVGKTTVTLALAAEAARRGHRVLVVDADPQANATDTIALQTFDPDSMPTLYDALDALSPGSALNAVHGTVWERVWIVPGDIQCARQDEFGIAAEQRLRIALEGCRDDYSVVLIDCPRALGALTTAALTASDKVAIVAEPTKDSLKGVGLVLATIKVVKDNYNADLVTAGVLLNRVGRTANRKMRGDQLRDTLAGAVHDDELREWASVARITEMAEILPLVGDSREATAGRVVAAWAQTLGIRQRRAKAHV